MNFATNVQQGWEWIDQLGKLLEGVALQYGYLGIFLVSLLGASSIIIPIPYTIIIFTMGSLPGFDPSLVAISGAAGSALGEFFGYFLGYYGRVIVSEKQQRKMEYILKLFSRHGAVTIFVFALTPLPDDLIFVPLGIMRYSFLKAFVPCLMGKLLMCFLLAYGGYLSIGVIGSILGGEGSIWTIIASTVLLVIIIVAMFKVDWEKFFPLEEKNRKKKKEKP